jgi:ribosomal protein S18 acetylase RimI-like enzyme
LFISEAEKNDAAAIARMLNVAYRGKGNEAGWTSEGAYLDGQRISEEEMGRLLRRPEIANFKCTTQDKKIVGFVSLKQQPDSLYLSMLTVLPEAQAGGIGRQLLMYAENYARSVAKTAIVITVVHIRNELIAWYERRGYHRTGRTEPFPAEAGQPSVAVHLIEMRKEIV